jgi:hypothetical protein
MSTKKDRQRHLMSLLRSAPTAPQPGIALLSPNPIISVNFAEATSQPYAGALNAPKNKEISMNNTFHPEPKADLIALGIPANEGEIQPVSDPEETRITAQVETLWKKHVEGDAKQKKSKEMLKRIRIELAERLFELKAVHCRAGRSGQFSATLKTLGIPRSTANRLVAVHERIAKTEEGNCPIGTTTGEPTPDDAAKKVRQLAVAAWKRVKKDLTTTELLEEFIEEFRNEADVTFTNAAEAKLATTPVKAPATAPCKPEMAAAA